MATTAAQQNPTAPPSRLGAVRVGRIPTPTTYVIYGPEGVGKTTLAAAAPGVIFMDIEDGSSEIATARYPFHPEDEKRAHVPRSYEEVLEAIDDLTVNQHAYKALAIDSLDKLESLIWRYMLKRDSQVSAQNKDGHQLNSIEDYGYGKGPIMAVEEWRALAARLDRLRYERQMEIILVGHAQVKNFKNPSGEDYDRYQLRINDKAASFLKEWAKVTAFACYEEDAKKISKFGRAKGFSTGVRLLKLARSAAVDAKSRLALPDEVVIDIENPWAPFAEAVRAARDVTPKGLAEQIEAEFKRIGDADRAARARPAIEKAVKEEDCGKLQRFLGDLQKHPSKEEEAAQ